MVFYYLFHTLYHQRQYMHQKSIYLLFTFMSTTDFKSIAFLNKENLLYFRNVYFCGNNAIGWQKKFP